MDEIFARGWANFLARLDGPMHFRCVVQPLVAVILGARAGLRDARAGELPYLWAVLRRREHRAERVKDALRDTASVLLVAALLDSVYQVAAHQSIFLLELATTVAVLALVPYLLVRGPVSRLARWRASASRSRASDGGVLETRSLAGESPPEALRREFHEAVEDGGDRQGEGNRQEDQPGDGHPAMAHVGERE